MDRKKVHKRKRRDRVYFRLEFDVPKDVFDPLLESIAYLVYKDYNKEEIKEKKEGENHSIDESI